MPQYDLYHNTVKNALIKDGWIITADPFVIEFKGLRSYADLGAEKVVAAEKSGDRIVVEIKVFNGPSPVTDVVPGRCPGCLSRFLFAARDSRDCG